ncbi:MAG: hypothetical protein M1838_000480 [Thelocarpon superellum]|nr:MAG: hypothetical protein M1838_000480 [Thelocarpon superellum]
MERRKSSTLHYQTFPGKPPTSRGPTPSSSPLLPGHDGPHSSHPFSSSHHGSSGSSPLPVKQLVVLALIALAEQTAFNSISPYLPEMASSFPEVDQSKVGLYVGLIASSFALAQFATNFFWGWSSDRIGRKPIILLGTLLTAACFVAFGFCRTLWQAVLVQVLMGAVNGNQGIVSTCLGEITDRSNQSKAFLYLPIVYGLGGITGPAVGGLLVSRMTPRSAYPYLAPNLFSAGVLVLDLIIVMLFLEESLEEARELPPLGKRVENLMAWLWQFTSSSRPSYLRLHAPDHRRRGNGAPVHSNHLRDGSEDDDDDDNANDEDEDDAGTEASSPLSIPALLPYTSAELKTEEVLNRDTMLLLVTYLIFQLCNVSFNSLYPIFASSPPPTGRALSPEEIGLSLSFAGAVTIGITLFFTTFGYLRQKLGNKATYRVGFAGFVISFFLMPWVGDKDSSVFFGQAKIWLWGELGAVLLVKTVATVGGLTSALLLKDFQITNSAPNHNVLGTLNGLAQTLSAAGRAAGPFLSGGLFSLSTQVRPKGEVLAWGVFGGVALVGFCLSFGIRGESLEGAQGDEEDGSIDEDDLHEDEDVDDDDSEELRWGGQPETDADPLLARPKPAVGSS